MNSPVTNTISHTDQSVALRIAVLTISDSRTADNDPSGNYLVEALTASGHQCHAHAVVPNDVWEIRKTVCSWIADPDIDLVISNGGTGYTHKKSTIEAMVPLLEQVITGFGELFRHLSYLDIGSSALQSDAIAGLANGKLIFCLPGSTGACRLAWDGVIRDQLDSQHKPCNFTALYR